MIRIKKTEQLDKSRQTQTRLSLTTFFQSWFRHKETASEQQPVLFILWLMNYPWYRRLISLFCIRVI